MAYLSENILYFTKINHFRCLKFSERKFYSNKFYEITKTNLDSVETFQCRLPMNSVIIHLMTELSSAEKKSYHVYILTDHKQVFRCEYRKEKEICSCNPATNSRKIQLMQVGKKQLFLLLIQKFIKFKKY